MNKKLMLITALFGITVLTAGLVSTEKIGKIEFLKSAGCDHVGYHYNAVEPTTSNSGNREFWICCKCHEIFLENPGSGSFTTQTLDKAIGGFTNSHIAYLSPTKGGSNGDYYVNDPFDEN